MNTQSWLWFAWKHICNIIEEIVFRSCTYLLFSKTISSIMFQICFLVNHSLSRVFKISKIIQNFDYKYISEHVLPCTQNCHLKTNSTHCAPPTSESPCCLSSGQVWKSKLTFLFHIALVFGHLWAISGPNGPLPYFFWALDILKIRLFHKSQCILWLLATSILSWLVRNKFLQRFDEFASILLLVSSNSKSLPQYVKKIKMFFHRNHF